MDKKPVKNLKLVEYSNSSSSDSDGEQEKPKKIRKIAVILPQIAPCPVHGNSPDSSPPAPPDQNNYDLDLDLEMAMDIQDNVETAAETETSGMPQNDEIVEIDAQPIVIAPTSTSISSPILISSDDESTTSSHTTGKYFIIF